MSAAKNSVHPLVRHPLAHKRGIELVVGLLMVNGAMCPKCGHGTRATSKRWARCKKCGERVQRHSLPNDNN